MLALARTAHAGVRAIDGTWRRRAAVCTARGKVAEVLLFVEKIAKMLRAVLQAHNKKASKFATAKCMYYYYIIIAMQSSPSPQDPGAYIPHSRARVRG